MRSALRSISLCLAPGLLDLSDPSCTTPCALIPDNFFNFYTWHFLDSTPLFKVNETLQLKEPLVYRGVAAGWLVVAFKVAVILPLIQAIRSYWKLRSDLPILRMDARPRIVHKDDEVTIEWALSEPPAGYVFDVTSRNQETQNRISIKRRPLRIQPMEIR